MMIIRTALMMILRGDLRPWALLNDDHENCPEDDDHEKRLEALDQAYIA